MPISIELMNDTRKLPCLLTVSSAGKVFDENNKIKTDQYERIRFIIQATRTEEP